LGLQSFQLALVAVPERVLVLLPLHLLALGEVHGLGFLVQTNELVESVSIVEIIISFNNQQLLMS
jgi:hypothetical protein